jgi:microcystin degradation protein MlrC
MSKPLRVAIGGISHETNAFSSIQTDLALFQRRTLLRGQALIDGSRGVSNTLGGMVDAAEGLGWTLVPTIFASATPSGRVQRGTFETLLNELLDGLRAAEPSTLDGVLLALHGALVAEAVSDGEGEILRRVRQLVGPALPIVVVLDFHANLTPAIAQHADVVIGYETYPHVDPYARGAEAVVTLARVQSGAIRPVRALRQVPMLTPLTAQWTLGPTPMRDLMRLALEAERQPGIVCVMLAGGFPFSDIHDAGLAVLVTADGDQALADATAERLALECWERREFFRVELTPVAEAIARLQTATRGPIVLADVADNPGAGGSNDGTTILDALVRASVQDVAFGVIADPASVARAEAIGAGGQGLFHLGGKLDHLHGPTLELPARARGSARPPCWRLGRGWK